MEPDDFNNDFASNIAGMLWAMYTRLRGEGATMVEAALITGFYFGALAHANPDQEDSK